MIYVYYTCEEHLYSLIVYKHGTSINCSLYIAATPSVYSYSSLDNASTNITMTTQAKGLRTSYHETIMGGWSLSAI